MSDPLRELRETRLPNGAMIAELNRHETAFLYDEIFTNASYSSDLRSRMEHAEVVVDVGANIGLFSLWAHWELGAPRIVAFEPVPQLHSLLEHNLSRHGVNHIAYPVALGRSRATATLTVYPRNSIISGLYADPEEEREIVRRYIHNTLNPDQVLRPELIDLVLTSRLQTQSSECEVRRLSEMLRQSNVDVVDLLKIDVEKSEADVLAGIDERDWSRIRRVLLETHDVAGRLKSTIALLEHHRFRCAVRQDAALSGTNVWMVTADR